MDMKQIERVAGWVQLGIQVLTAGVAVATMLVLLGACARTPEERAQFYQDYMMGRAMTAPLAPVATKDPACYAMREDAIYYRLYCR